MSYGVRLLAFLPLDAGRLRRPASVFRYTFDYSAGMPRHEYGDDGAFAFFGRARPPGRVHDPALEVIPIEAVAFGDVQVLAAGGLSPRSVTTPTIHLGVLADFPSVESVVVSTAVR